MAMTQMHKQNSNYYQLPNNNNQRDPPALQKPQITTTPKLQTKTSHNNFVLAFITSTELGKQSLMGQNRKCTAEPSRDVKSVRTGRQICE